jgi:TetR/AcrR family transcriptional regulator of autoinduction and epiphytic fitness
VGENSVEFSAREKRIIDAAIELFKDQGYEITTIADIVDAAHISKSTFYMHFANKKELFEKCFKSIFKGFVAESLEAIGDETDIIEVFRKIPLPLIRNYSKWNAMLSQLRAASVYDTKNFGDKFEEVLDMFAEPISLVLDIAKRKGQLKNVNTKLLAVTLQGMLDYTNYYQARGRFGLDVEEFIEQGLDIILHGALKQPP